MQYFVTGATGFIGKRLVKTLLARKGATDKGTWMSFDKKQHDALKAIFEHASDQVAAIHLKTHGRKKVISP